MPRRPGFFLLIILVTIVMGCQNTKEAKALFNRGINYDLHGDADRAIADYTQVIGMKGAPAELVAKALVYRGNTYNHRGDHAHAIADYARAVGLKHSPATVVAWALTNRGNISAGLARYAALYRTSGEQGDRASAIADYTQVIGMKGATVDQVAEALVDRGEMYGEQGDADSAVADYTRVIGMKDARDRWKRIADDNLTKLK